MPLTSFGSILTFAEEIETQDSAFYTGAVDNPECAGLKSLPEVANALRLLGKKHNARLRKINDI